jgi:hypothetical protein
MHALQARAIRADSMHEYNQCLLMKLRTFDSILATHIRTKKNYANFSLVIFVAHQLHHPRYGKIADYTGLLLKKNRKSRLLHQKISNC